MLAEQDEHKERALGRGARAVIKQHRRLTDRTVLSKEKFFH
jgi:hypothetical protein